MSTPPSLPTLPPTVSSRVYGVGSLPGNSAHPFSAGESSSSLRDLVQSLDQITHTLSTYSQATQFTNPKLISLLRQHAAIANTVNQSGQSARKTVTALRKRGHGTQYGMEVPVDHTILADWCLSRVESYAKEAGMEAFRDDSDGKLSLAIAGKLVVIDMEFTIRTDVPEPPRAEILACKIQYADASGTTTNGAPCLDDFLKESISALFKEVQRDQYDPLEARRLGDLLLSHIRYMVRLEKLAELGGLGWFTNVDQLGLVAEELAKKESEVVASSLSLVRAPLDILIMRGHAFPLPCFNSPTLSFLVHLSPSAYLSLLRAPPHQTSEPSQLSTLDIPISTLRANLNAHPRPPGAAIATLWVLEIHPDRNLPSSSARPTFPLVPEGEGAATELPTSSSQAWVLDFTEDGTTSGIVLSQSRMREIERLVDARVHDMGHIDPGMMSFGVGSWVDLLLNPSNPVSPERYTALYRSPSSAHPPLQLRLTTPQEPGFHLQRVRVRNLKEIRGILEVVREQCWINEVLKGCHWTTDGLTLDRDDEIPEDKEEATLDELQAVLKGTITPRKIPVNVYLPSPGGEGDIFSSEFMALDPSMAPPSTRPQIVMSSPERPPMSGLVEITVSYDESRVKGVEVTVKGAMDSEVNEEALEEVVRRGGTLGLAGRIWAGRRG